VGRAGRQMHVLNLIRHPRPRRLHLRGVALAGRLRGRGALVDPPRHRGQTAGQPYLAMRTTHRRSGAEQNRPAAPSRRSTPPSWRTSSGCDGRRPPRECQDRRGVTELLHRSWRDPASGRGAGPPARAMIFDSVYDSYRDVVTYVRVTTSPSKGEDPLCSPPGATHEDAGDRVSSPEPEATRGPGGGESVPDHRRQGRAPAR